MSTVGSMAGWAEAETRPQAASRTNSTMPRKRNCIEKPLFKSEFSAPSQKDGREREHNTRLGVLVLLRTAKQDSSGSRRYILKCCHTGRLLGRKLRTHLLMSTQTIAVHLPDGSVREVRAGTTPLDIANSISPRLAAASVVARLDRKSTRL